MFEFFARLFLFPVAPAADLPDRPEPQVQPASPLRRRPSPPSDPEAGAVRAAAGPGVETPSPDASVPTPIRAER